MRAILARNARRAIRLGTGISLVPVGILTAILFCTTGRPVPRGFVPKEGQGFGLDLKDQVGAGGLIRVTWLMSADRKYDIGLTLPDGVQPHGSTISDELTATVFDHFTYEKLAWFSTNSENIRRFALTPDRRFLVSFVKGKLYVRRLQGASGAVEEFSDDICLEDDKSARISFSFARNSRHVLIYSDEKARVILYDLYDRKTVLNWKSDRPSEWIIPICFFDSNGRPKALVNKEVLDLVSNKTELALTIPSRGIVRIDDIFYMANAPYLASYFFDSGVLLFHALDDGRLVQESSIPPGLSEGFQFSPQGRFLIATSIVQRPFLKVANGLSNRLESWLTKIFPDEERSVLLDLKTGNTWCDVLGKGLCSFADDGAQMVSFVDEGHYIYDVPPKARLFTPWSWAAVGGWLGLIGLWWGLRRRKRGIPTSSGNPTRE